MAILARYQNIMVEVVDVLTTGDNRKRAVIRALQGKPFTGHSFNGGPYATDCAVVSPDLLTEVHQAADERQANPYGKTRRSRIAGAKPEPVYVPFEPAELEGVKPLFPVRSRREPWKGINSD